MDNSLISLVLAWINGHARFSSLRGVLSIDDPDVPVLVTQIGESSLVPDLVPRIPYQLATLIGAKSHADGLARLLAEVPPQSFEHGLSILAADDLSGLFRCQASRITEIVSSFRGRHRHLSFLIKPTLAYWIGILKTMDLLDTPPGEGGLEDLADILASVRQDLPVSGSELVEICRQSDSPWEIRDKLGLDFAKFNTVLNELGAPYEPQLNDEEHRSVFAEYVEGNRVEIENALRVASLDAFDNGRFPSEYALHRTFTGLEPDPGWLMSCARPMDKMMQARVDAWLNKRGARSHVKVKSGLAPLQRVLRANRRILGELLTELPPIVSAWLEKNKVTAKVPWDHADPRDAIASRVEDSGVLDFRILEKAGIITWIDRLSLWPSGMPRSTDPEKLGIGTEDIERAKRQADSARAAERRADVSLPLDGKDVSFEDNGIAEITRLLDESIDTGKSMLPRNIAVLEDESGSGRRGGSRKSAGGGRGQSDQSMSEAQRNLIGFVGEWVVFRALQRTYGIDHTNWISGNRALRFDCDGTDDTRGYDFFVVTRTGKIYFEVKATTGDEGFLRLGQTELDFAQRHADRRESYRILHVTHTLDSTKRRIVRLPNPFGPRGRGKYRLREGELQLYFRLPH